MIHLVFQKSDVDALQQAFLLDAFMQGEVLLIADDYAVGPLGNIYSPEGIAERKQWWRDVLAGGDYDGIVDDGSVPDDHKTVASLKETLQNDPGETLWIWAAQNKHDVSGYYWLISQLQEFQGRNPHEAPREDTAVFAAGDSGALARTTDRRQPAVQAGRRAHGTDPHARSHDLKEESPGA